MHNKDIESNSNSKKHILKPLVSDDKLDLFQFLSILMESKRFIALITSLFMALGIVYSLTLPNIYQSSVLLAPVHEPSPMDSAIGQFSGLASLAGVNLGKQADQTNQIALASLKSRKFITEFVNNHHLLPELMALKTWDADSNTLVFDHDIYDEKLDSWRGHKFHNDSSMPTASEGYKAFMKTLTVEENKETGFIRLSINSKSPYLSQQWLNWLVEDINQWMKIRKVDSSKMNIRYLEAQKAKTSIADMVNIFNSLIEMQTKQLMLAEANVEFAFQTIDNAVVPEEKLEPHRSTIVAVFFSIGFFISIAFIFIRAFFRGEL